MRKVHITKQKGDIGLTKIIADLTEKEFAVSLPISEHLPYDLVVDIDGKLIKIQVKYSKKNYINGTTSHPSKKGNIITKYKINDFDYYALYMPEINECVYIPNTIEFTSITLRTTHPKTRNVKYYWWEDFKDFKIKRLPLKHSIDDFKIKPKFISRDFKFRKVKNRPEYQQLLKEINELGYRGTGKKYDVTDNAVRKWKINYEKEINGI